MTEKPDTFESIFFPTDATFKIKVPDYQRAFSWRTAQIELFLGDLVKNRDAPGRYYYGHFIAQDRQDEWEIVDGQQRITTFVLFLMVCELLAPTGHHVQTFSLIDRFTTVSYDADALKKIRSRLGPFLEIFGKRITKDLPSDEEVTTHFEITAETFTRSQRGIVLALLRIHQAFLPEEKSFPLQPDRIAEFIGVIMKSHCSHHLTTDQTVAVNIFEMHNTRGVFLTTMEIIKAILMKFVFDHGGNEVSEIQKEFGEIYAMEERLATRSFRGDMTTDQLLKLHLRVIDDGNKKSADDFRSPPANASGKDLISYVEGKLTDPGGLDYAIALAKELKTSMQIVSGTLPDWDRTHPTVGDVLILEKDLSCQLFLLMCRTPEGQCGKLINDYCLMLWERLLFTRDFHGEYYRMKYTDDFPTLFAECIGSQSQIESTLTRYLTDGFRPGDITKNLQEIVKKYLKDNEKQILERAYHWWKGKMAYAIYKYETKGKADLRDVMKGTISMEHILPQSWEWKWIKDGKLSDEEEKKWQEEINGFINGIGNLLLLTPSENTSAGKLHPSKKKYGRYPKVISADWSDPNKWGKIVEERGKDIVGFMIENLVGFPDRSNPD